MVPAIGCRPAIHSVTPTIHLLHAPASTPSTILGGWMMHSSRQRFTPRMTATDRMVSADVHRATAVRTKRLT